MFLLAQTWNKIEVKGYGERRDRINFRPNLKPISLNLEIKMK